jgi:sterol desaturase/sphingolipid hydroxylase (fatty acid hydroxylase superfamily)
MESYIEIIGSSFTQYAQYLWHEITHPTWHNYFYYLIAISLFFWSLELLFPWRKKQAAFRKDFWLDTFYMFFNFFIFSLIGFNAVSNVAVEAFNDFLHWAFGITNLVAINIAALPTWTHILLLFVVKDFIQWCTHILLHRTPWLWEFHKVHHSVEEMGFAAHLRFHWMENVVYKTIQYVPLAMLGFGLQDFLLVDMFAIAVGHFNHSNVNIPLGPLKYLLNNPQMHIWHHAKDVPQGHGVNFGITLSLWDYLFGTAFIPKNGRDEVLGFEDEATFPKSFWSQFIYPFIK